MKRHSLSIALLIVFLVGGSLFAQSLRSSSTKPTDVSVKLKWLHQGQFAGMYLAKNNGWYEQKDINLNLIPQESSDREETIKAVAHGEIDFAIVEPIAFLNGFNQGLDVIALAAIYQKSPSIIATLNSSGINEPKDLRGKKLGVVGGGLNARMVFNELLKQGGVPVNTVVYKDVGFRQFESLLDGTVDATSFYRTRQAPLLNKADDKINFIKPEDYGIILPDDIIITSNAFLKENTELVNNFVDTTIRGWETVIENPELGVDATMFYVTGEFDNKDYQRSIVNSSVPLIKPTPSTRIGVMNVESWKQVYNLITSNQVMNPRDFTQAFTNDFVSK